jgi:hypothetical protein
LMQNTALKVRDRKMKKPTLQERRLIICLSNYG